MKKKRPPAPVPRANRSKAGPPQTTVEPPEGDDPTGQGFHEQDPKRRLGGFETAGEHARQQPGPLNDG